MDMTEVVVLKIATAILMPMMMMSLLAVLAMAPKHVLQGVEEATYTTLLLMVIMMSVVAMLLVLLTMTVTLLTVTVTLLTVTVSLLMPAVPLLTVTVPLLVVTVTLLALGEARRLRRHSHSGLKRMWRDTWHDFGHHNSGRRLCRNAKRLVSIVGHAHAGRQGSYACSGLQPRSSSVIGGHAHAGRQGRYA